MKIAFYTLGCKVNQYETEMLREKFRALGWETVGAEEPADLFVVNTCTVTGLADRKSRQYIRRMKRVNPDAVTAVIGCYAQVSPEGAASVEGVDLVLGTEEKNDLPAYVERFLRERRPVVAVGDRKAMSGYRDSGTISAMDGRTRAYIKIQEGCDRFCSYCVIPYARGPVRSRAPESVLAEAERLVQQGFKEIVLTGINTALYGTESGFREEYGIPDGQPPREGSAERPDECSALPTSGLEYILGRLDALPGDFRIRLSSLEPNVVRPDETLRLLRFRRLCHHLHLSIQSGADSVLRRMNRRYTAEDYTALVRMLREADPFYGVSSDVIVGFPGETEAEFAESVRVCREIGFTHAHVFPYSKRPGTVAAEMDGQIPAPVKKERAARLASAADEASLAFFRAMKGIKRTVLWERFEPDTGCLTGYTDNYVKVYRPVSPEDAAPFENTFETVSIGEPFASGVKGE